MRAQHLSRRRFVAGIAAGSGAAILGQLGCSTRPGTALPSDPARLDLRDVRSRSLSPVELTRACLERIERLDTN